MGLTLRLILLAIMAAAPAVAIQIWNEYDLRRVRMADVREQVLRLARSETAEYERGTSPNAASSTASPKIAIPTVMMRLAR